MGGESLNFPEAEWGSAGFCTSPLIWCIASVTLFDPGNFCDTAQYESNKFRLIIHPTSDFL